ncbi:MAG: hypothetical protein E7560_06785 [Ruminococcaceae bacterium]|nr:hypothetical protein [Oscillospiraceae bacterium]
MKKLIINVFKTLFFFDLAVVFISFLPIIKASTTALSVFIGEILIFSVVLGFSLVFGLIVERRTRFKKQKVNPMKPLLFGLIFGLILPIIAITILTVLKKFDIITILNVSHIYFWLPAILLNAISCELLLHGYLLRLFKREYGFCVASIVTTLLYLSLNFEVLKMGGIVIANAILLNLILCFIIEYSGSIISAITAHFFYSVISSFVFGSQKIWPDAPYLIEGLFTGKNYLSGGAHRIEGSIALLIPAAIILGLLIYKKYSREILGGIVFAKNKFVDFKDFILLKFKKN